MIRPAFYDAAGELVYEVPSLLGGSIFMTRRQVSLAARQPGDVEGHWSDVLTQIDEAS